MPVQTKFLLIFYSCSFCRDNCDAPGLRGDIQKLNDSLCQVLSAVFNCDRFAAELLKNFDNDHIRVCVEIMKRLLQSLTTNNSHYLSYVDIEQKNIMHHMLYVCIPKGKEARKKIKNFCSFMFAIWIFTPDFFE